MASLYDRYKPTSWRQIVGQDVALARLHTVKKTTGFVGNAFFIEGASGTGKGCICDCLARTVANGSDNVIVTVDGSSLKAEDVREWRSRRLIYRPLPPATAWVWCVHEAQKLSDKVRTELLVILESPEFARMGVAIFTAMPTQRTLFGDESMASAFISRCIHLQLANDATYRLAAARRVREIALELNLDGQPESAYVALLADVNGNFRMALSRISSGAMMF